MCKFIEALEKARSEYPPDKRWRVVVGNHYKEFVTNEGSTYGIDMDKNIGGLCRKFGSKETGHELLKKAVKAGGRKLQAFGHDLFTFYTTNNFRPISWCQFDPKYAPPGWQEEYGNQPLIFYAYDSKYHPFQRGLFFLFVCSTKPSKDADEAAEIRDRWIINEKKKIKKRERRKNVKQRKNK